MQSEAADLIVKGCIYEKMQGRIINSEGTRFQNSNLHTE